jgi:hypothetical protein
MGASNGRSNSSYNAVKVSGNASRNRGTKYVSNQNPTPRDSAVPTAGKALPTTLWLPLLLLLLLLLLLTTLADTDDDAEEAEEERCPIIDALAAAADGMETEADADNHRCASKLAIPAQRTRPQKIQQSNDDERTTRNHIPSSHSHTATHVRLHTQTTHRVLCPH